MDRKLLTGLLVVSFILWTYGAYNALMVYGPIKTDIAPMQELYRNVFFHVPINVSMYLGFTITLISSIFYIKTRDIKWDNLAYSSAKVALFFATFTLITGVIWAKPAWGTYWNWDPRETTALVLWFAFAAYFALRASLPEENSRARISAVLGIFAYFTIPMTYFSARIFPSLHPNPASFELEGMKGMVLGLMILAMLFIFINILILEKKLNLLHRRYELHKLEVEDR